MAGAALAAAGAIAAVITVCVLITAACPFLVAVLVGIAAIAYVMSDAVSGFITNPHASW